MEALPLPKHLTYVEMAALFDGLRTMKEVGLGLVSQGRFKGEPGLYNEAGNVLDDLVELIGRTKDAVAEMAEAARPCRHSSSYSDDFADRALVMVQAGIDCEGITSAVALATSLYSQDGRR